MPRYLQSGGSAWTDFVKAHAGQGKTLKELSVLYKKTPAGKKAAAKRKSPAKKAAGKRKSPAKKAKKALTQKQKDALAYGREWLGVAQTMSRTDKELAEWEAEMGVPAKKVVKRKSAAKKPKRVATAKQLKALELARAVRGTELKGALPKVRALDRQSVG